MIGAGSSSLPSTMQSLASGSRTIGSWRHVDRPGGRLEKVWTEIGCVLELDVCTSIGKVVTEGVDEDF